MTLTRWTLRSALGVVAVTTGLCAWAAPAQAPGIVALKSLEKGLWQLNEAGVGRRDVCLTDPAILLQPRNRGVACSRFVIDNSPDTATIHYTCPASGHGRTTLTVETPRLVQVDSHGLEGGAPFDVKIEARRVGNCG